MKANEKYSELYNKFKDHKKTEGYNLKNIKELYFPLWFCRQKIAVEKELEVDRFSRVLLSFIGSKGKSHVEVCEFLGVDEDDFTLMQIYFLTKQGFLIEELYNDNTYYVMSQEGKSFLDKAQKAKQIDEEVISYYYDGLQSVLRANLDSVYNVVQSHKFKNTKEKEIMIKHDDKPTLSKIKQVDWNKFYQNLTSHENLFFYSFLEKQIETHKRHIPFLAFIYKNKDEEFDIDIRKYEKTVRDFKKHGYELEERLSKSVNKKQKKDEKFLKYFSAD